MKKVLLFLLLIGGGALYAQVHTYSSVAGNFSVEAVDGTKGLYITNAPFTISADRVACGYGFRVNSSGKVKALNMTSVAVSNDTVTPAGESANFASGDTVALFLPGGDFVTSVTENHTCGENEDDVTDNLFTVTGACRILQVYGVVTVATEVTDFEAFKIQLYDGTNTVDMCAASELDGITVNSTLLRDEDGDALVELDGSQTRFHEITGNLHTFTEGVVIQKSATTTYIRSIFNGNDVDATIVWYIRWWPLTSSSVITGV